MFFFQGFSELGRVHKAKLGSENQGFSSKFPTANLLGFSLWGRGLVTWKCTPRKTGAVLEPCWNLSLGCKGGLMWGCNLQGFHTGYEQFWEKESQVWPRSCVTKYGNGASYFFFRFGCLTRPWGRGFAMFWLLNGSLVGAFIFRWTNGTKVPIHFCSWGGLKPATLRRAGS